MEGFNLPVKFAGFKSSSWKWRANFPPSASFQDDDAGGGPSPAALVHFLSSFNSYN